MCFSKTNNILISIHLRQNCDAISALGIQIAPHQCVEVFAKIDEDGGGSITFGELCEWFVAICLVTFLDFYFGICIRYLEFNKPALIEVKLSKKEIIGRLKQQVKHSVSVLKYFSLVTHQSHVAAER